MLYFTFMRFNAKSSLSVEDNICCNSKFYSYPGRMPHGEVQYEECVFLVGSKPIPTLWKSDVEGLVP